MDAMDDRPTIAAQHTARPAGWQPGAEGWQAIGGALTASFAIHVLVVVALAAIVARPVATRADAAGRIPIVALLISEPRADREEAAAPAIAPSKVAHATPQAVPAPPSPRRAGPSVVPWSATPIAVDPPASLLTRPMTSEGVHLVETRNLAALGESIERRILRGYESEPQDPVRLKPPETIGYPLHVLAAGVEGTVLVWFGVDEEGKVIEKEALDGPPELMEWVLERVDRLVEGPARIGITPVRAWVAMEVHFTRALADEAATRSAAAQAAEAAAGAAPR